MILDSNRFESLRLIKYINTGNSIYIYIISSYYHHVTIISCPICFGTYSLIPQF